MALQKVLKIKKYSKTLSLKSVNRPNTQRQTAEFMFDAMGELWYESKQEFMQARESEDGKKALAMLKEDELRFVDLAQSVMWLGEEELII